MNEFISGNKNSGIDDNPDFMPAKLNNKDFARLSEFITGEFGIKMPDIKRIMLQSRLQKRLKELGFDNFSDYVDYLFSKEGMEQEVIHMIDVVSTNKTDFFRENVHFEYLLGSLLPELYPHGKRGCLKVWSAGCSSGEEPYTLAIVLSEYQVKNPLMDFMVYGTDISTRMLKTAHQAIYSEDKINNIPLELKTKYFLRSKNREDKKVRIIPELREKVMFSRMNLIDDYYSTPFDFDVVFCRNVLIYFDRRMQERIILKLCSKIRREGILFLGHSESVAGLDLPLKHIQPTIFMKL
jgi:chemotaxis protein methyltransferase CheR